MRRLALAALTLVAALAIVAAPSSAQTGDGQVVVVHGVPGLTVDVYVNGDKTLPNFEPGTVTDPISLPAGDYKIDIRPAGADPSSDPAISKTVTLPAGAFASLVAHLDADGNPTLTPYVEDLAATPAGKGRLIVRHTAAAPAVDVLAGGSPVITDLSNPESSDALTLDAGTVSASVAATGTTDPVIGPADVPVAEGKVTIVYAVGSLQEESLGVVVETLDVGVESASTTAPADSTTTVPVPAAVQSGNAGLAADGGSSFPVALATILAVFGLALTGLGAYRLSVARRNG